MDADLRANFLEGMSRVAAAVTVATTDGEAGRHGVTVSSMTSVSADTARPSLLISVHHLSHACDAIRKNRRFCANVLSGNQSFVSDLFSGRLKHLKEDRFAAIDWHTGATGSPIIDDALVSLDCELKTALLWGTHVIFIGEAEQIDLSAQRSPLVYANRGYRRAIPITPEDRSQQKGENRLTVGFFITLAPELVPSLVSDFIQEWPDVDLRLLEADHDDLVEQLRAGRIEAAVTFGTIEGPDLETELLRASSPHVLLSGNHPLASRQTLRLAELAPLPMILLDYPSVRTVTDALFQRGGLQPSIRFQSPSFAMVRGLVAQGLGYSIVPQPPQSASDRGGRSLVAIPLKEDFPEGDLILAKRPAAQNNQLANDFIERCRASFARNE